MKNLTIGQRNDNGVPLQRSRNGSMVLNTLLLFVLIFGTATSPSFGAGRVLYDGFESGTTSVWQQDGFRNICQVVATAADGVVGPYSGSKMARCNWNGTVAWNSPGAFETLFTRTNYNKELFYRVRLRADKNLDRTGGSPAKIMRIYNTTPVYNDIFGVIQVGNGVRNEGVANATQLVTYWGGGDNAANTSGWHTVEYYINQSTNRLKVWHDSKLIRDDTIPSIGNGRWSDFFLLSNWSDAHDATNFVYFDEIEIFSDLGTGAGGLMSDATVFANGGQLLPAPKNVR